MATAPARPATTERRAKDNIMDVAEQKDRLETAPTYIPLMSLETEYQGGGIWSFLGCHIAGSYPTISTSMEDGVPAGREGCASLSIGDFHLVHVACTSALPLR